MKMLYIALISHDDVYRDPEIGNRCNDQAFLTLGVEADSVENALDACKRKLIQLHDEHEIFHDVYEFYLEDIVEVGGLDQQAKLLNWFCLHPFGTYFATMLYGDSDGDPSISHCDVDDDEWHEVEPFLDINVERRLSRPLFKSLLKQKMRGVLPPFDELTDGDLYELFVVEGCIRKEIAELFDVSLSKLDRRRRAIGATFDESVLYSFLTDRGLMEPTPFHPSDA